MTPLLPCKKSALANNSRGDRDAPPTVIQALVAVVARTVPAIPSPLRESLVIHHYDVSKLTPAFRWDTVILEVPKPERVLPLTRGMYGLTAAEILRAQVEPWLLAPRSDPAAVLDWMRYNPNIFGPDGRRRHFRWEMGDISARYRHHRCELHPLEQGDRELRVWLDPFRPTSDAWFRVQFTPLHRDHQWFVGQLRTMLGEAWSHVRVVRLDAAFDFAGTVNDLVPIYERRRKPNRTEPMPTASGSHRSILCGS
ncbi:MAG TPA: hypothetical protein PLA94_03195, partial [Myxococcota bacterium]|nr:hypothetical protein [Myxococcota bacterium]